MEFEFILNSVGSMEELRENKKMILEEVWRQLTEAAYKKGLPEFPDCTKAVGRPDPLDIHREDPFCAL